MTAVSRQALACPESYRPAAAREYLDEVRDRALDVLDARGPGDGFLHELIIRHEQQHGETMLQTLQLKAGAPYAAPRAWDSRSRRLAI